MSVSDISSSMDSLIEYARTLEGPETINFTFGIADHWLLDIEHLAGIYQEGDRTIISFPEHLDRSSVFRRFP